MKTREQLEADNRELSAQLVAMTQRVLDLEREKREVTVLANRMAAQRTDATDRAIRAEVRLERSVELLQRIAARIDAVFDEEASDGT